MIVPFVLVADCYSHCTSISLMLAPSTKEISSLRLYMTMSAMLDNYQASLPCLAIETSLAQANCDSSLLRFPQLSWYSFLSEIAPTAQITAVWCNNALAVRLPGRDVCQSLGSVCLTARIQFWLMGNVSFNKTLPGRTEHLV